MSRYSYTPLIQRPHITVHDHDVLSGRGVNIAHHSGNQRFRTLVTTRGDESYCAAYSASEKRAVAEEIIKHIQALDPPGRFLKRDGRGQVSRGLSGPWEELTERESVKKACQALRDCNRLDRQGYASGVAMPTDVLQSARHREDTGLTGKQQAARAAAEVAAAQAAATIPSNKRDWGRVSPSVENAAEWLKKQRTDEAITTVTPSTSGSDTMNGGGPVSYDPASLGVPPYEQFQPPAQYVHAHAPMYPPAPAAPLEGYAPAPYTPGLAPEGYAPTSELPNFPTAPAGEPFQPAPMYHMAAAPVTTFQPASTPVPYPQSAGEAAAAATTDSTNQGAPTPANPAFAYPPGKTHPRAPPPTNPALRQTHSGAPPIYPAYAHAPTPAGQAYASSPASQPAPSPYAPLAPANGGGTYHQQAFHHAPPPIYHQPHPSNGPYAAAPDDGNYAAAPAPVYNAGHASVAYQEPAHTAPAPMYPAAPAHDAYQAPIAPQPAYPPLTEPDLHAGPAPIAPPGTEPVYGSTTMEYHPFGGTSATTQQPSSHTFPAHLSDTGYDQEDLLAASAGADLLISAAYQSAAPSASEAQALVDAAVVAAAQWEGEALGL